MGILHRSSVLSIDVIRALSCSVNLQPEALFAEVQDPDATVTFDDVVGYNANYENHPVNISAGGIIITLQGSLECGLFDDFGLGQGGWFLGLSGGGSTAFCEIVFSYPVSRFSMRVASDMYAEGGIFAFDESGEELNCHLFPWVTETNNNAYSVRGFNSSTNNIKRIVLKESYLVAYLLSFIVCPDGYNLIKEICQANCETVPSPCGANTNCTNFEDVAQCMCLDYHEGNVTTGCTPVNCESDLCNEHATCSEITSEPFVSCACMSGFMGDGFGDDGCVASPATPRKKPAHKSLAQQCHYWYPYYC